MTTHNLFLPVCGTILLVMTIVAAVLGMKSRIKFADQLIKTYRKGESNEDWRKKYYKKQRIILITALFSVLGIFLLAILIFMEILLPSKILLVILVTLIAICVIAGALLGINSRKLIE